MRKISLWNITSAVQSACVGKNLVVPGYFPAPILLNALTIGKEHQHLEPGHYVLVDHDMEGEAQAVTIKVVAVGSPYFANRTVDMRSLGSLSAAGDTCVCQVFQLMPTVNQKN